MYATTAEQERAVKVRKLAADLYTENLRNLRRMARREGGPGVDPNEAVQEAFALFLAHYDTQAGSPPLAWLRLTLRRWCWAACGRRRHAGRLGAAPSGLAAPDEPWWRQWRLAVDDGDVAGRLDRIEQVSAGMERLRPEQRRALSLLALGYTYSEIGERLGLSEKQVDHRLSAGRAALRSADG